MNRNIVLFMPPLSLPDPATHDHTWRIVGLSNMKYNPPALDVSEWCDGCGTGRTRLATNRDVLLLQPPAVLVDELLELRAYKETHP